VSAAPVVSATPTGAFVVVWESASGGDGSDGGIVGRVFDAAGVPLAGEFQVNEYTTGSQYQPDVAIDPMGVFVVVWTSPSDGSTTGVVGRRFDATGSPLSSEFAVNVHTELYQDGPSVGMEASGKYIIVFRDYIGYPNNAVVKGRRYDASGVPLGAEFQVSTLSAPYAYGESLPEVAVQGSGEFVVSWAYLPPGAPERVMARRFDSAGVPVTGDIWMGFGIGTGVPWGSQVGVAPSGGFIVTWTTHFGYLSDGEYRGTQAQRFDATGTPQGPIQFFVNTYTPRDERSPQVAVDSLGRFVIVWEQEPYQAIGQDGDGAGIFGQRYDASGAPVHAFIPVSAGRITLKDPGPANRRKMGFRSADPRVANGVNPVINPLLSGAVLHVYNSSGGDDSACYALPAAGWKQAGTQDDPLYVYRDTQFALGPCNAARIRPYKYTRANCFSKLQSIPYTLDEPMQGSVAAALTVGPVTYCADLGGTVLSDQTGLFKAKGAPAPGACATPPASCP
jgi:hypothetical protein